MKNLYAALIIIPFISCTAQIEDKKSVPNIENDRVTDFYKAHLNESLPSKSKGSVSNGSIENAWLLPFSGVNYCYFDTSSYLNRRAFSTEQTINAVVNSYEALQDVDRTFYVMELSNEHGGKMFPHRTHQNGLSVDLMVPLLKDNKPYTDLDQDGLAHYILEFNKKGQLTRDTTIHIDFDIVARHILALEKSANEQGLKIQKVIINTDLKDELFSTPYGKELKKSGIYIVRNLEKLINDLHDDHYHVDFEKI